MITNEALHKKSPQELTSLLYEALLDNLEEGKAAIQSRDFMIANEKLQKANDILHRLGGGLNYEAGIVSDQLDALYNYASDLVVEANYTKDETKVDQALNALTPIVEAWQTALKTNQDKQPKMMKQKANAYEQSAIYE
ncbi:flagellar export chaperone FliS [Salisediminibacterium selenitireducens]|uniref:Flagellar secretion chaperone FliS n=1 Tax=Bacillus selenitireducens (strain ATCC 700615 / DSM 15326 / MLS10) TaxID=439292 RepID=D6XVK3_BACIE|nr:flagellar export chaperone FliS [Salisediminibacterium selenitireducens]ADH99741.1 flagellar protein FliS [[Bacillus] selenitireducens MLS10]